MADQVSWLLIEPGWKVETSDGEDAGRIEEVVGDLKSDIFDGLVISHGMFRRPRYVASEQVSVIVEGRVALTVARAALDELPEHAR